MARRAAALDDALALLTLALGDAEGARGASLTATVLLERARAHEARADYEAAETDVHAARTVLAGAREPRLELRSLRLLGGDIAVARRHPLVEVIDRNRAGRGLAAELGDAVAEAMFRTRIVVLEATRLRLGVASELAVSGVSEARHSGSPEAVARSLDGLKSAHASCGDAAALGAVVDELLPLLGRLRLPWLMQWALLESALVPAAEGRWESARRRVDEALAVNRATGYDAYAGFFRAQRGWLARLAGDLDAALDDGRRSVVDTSPAVHPWWYATAVGTYASTLLELGRPDEAAELCAAGLRALGDEAGAAYRLRCLAPLTAATGERLHEADSLLSSVQAPPGRAWVVGADAYLGVAAGWEAAGEPARARRALAPLLAATSTRSWAAIHTAVRQRSSARS
jgi:tetratricopeptide (TPR) repeat protein